MKKNAIKDNVANMNDKPLTAAQKRWLEKRRTANIRQGSIMRPPVSAAEQLHKSIIPFFRSMDEAIKESIFSLFTSHGGALNLSDLATSRLEKLMDKFTLDIDTQFEPIVKGFLERVDMSSKSAVTTSLKELSGGITINPDFLADNSVLSQQFRALMTDNVALFKTITADNFAAVQKAVNDSIVSGNGLADLVPFFNSYSNGEKNYGKNRALDQTRKAFESLNTTRLKNSGVQKVKWIHSGGSNEPRKLHQEYNQRIFRLDDPPYIGDMYGQKVYGWGGCLPNCRCTVIPIFDFEGE